MAQNEQTLFERENKLEEDREIARRQQQRFEAKLHDRQLRLLQQQQQLEQEQLQQQAEKSKLEQMLQHIQQEMRNQEARQKSIDDQQEILSLQQQEGTSMNDEQIKDIEDREKELAYKQQLLLEEREASLKEQQLLAQERERASQEHQNLLAHKQALDNQQQELQMREHELMQQLQTGTYEPLVTQKKAGKKRRVVDKEVVADMDSKETKTETVQEDKADDDASWKSIAHVLSQPTSVQTRGAPASQLGGIIDQGQGIEEENDDNEDNDDEESIDGTSVSIEQGDEILIEGQSDIWPSGDN